MLVSQSVRFRDAAVWNPYLDQKDEATVAKVKAVSNALLKASDHLPVSAVRDFWAAYRLRLLLKNL